jgi:hypothetical protein
LIPKWLRQSGPIPGVTIVAALVLCACYMVVTLRAVFLAARTMSRTLEDLPVAPLSVRSMSDNLLAHRAEFEQVVRMVQEDQTLERLTLEPQPLIVPAEPGLSAGRLRQYQEGLRQLAVRGGLETGQRSGEVRFVASTWQVFCPCARGYAYVIEPPQPLVLDLEAYRPDQRCAFIAYEYVEERWYIYDTCHE